MSAARATAGASSTDVPPNFITSGPATLIARRLRRQTTVARAPPSNLCQVVRGSRPTS
jgi:hypothetical protein